MLKISLILSLLFFTNVVNAEIDPELMRKAKQGDAEAQYSLFVNVERNASLDARKVSIGIHAKF